MLEQDDNLGRQTELKYRIKEVFISNWLPHFSVI
jgi:hypothetical protein